MLVCFLDVTRESLGVLLECLSLDLSVWEVDRRRPGLPRWPDQKPARSRGRGPSQACLAVTSTRAGAGNDATERRGHRMSIVAEHYQFVIGVDTHAASHAFAIIDAVHSGVLAQAEFPATGSGMSRAVAWAARRTDGHGAALAVVEGLGSYGAPVARTLTQAGYRVVEAQPQPAANRRGKGKSDPLDAVRIARSVLGTEVSELRIPRADGARNALRILITARELITRERTATVNALTSLVRTEDLGIDARRSLTMAQLRQIAGWRARANEPIDVAVARLEATRLARHALDLGEQAIANARHIHQLVAQVPLSCSPCPASVRSPRQSSSSPELGHPHDCDGPNGKRRRDQGLRHPAHRRGQDQARGNALRQALPHPQPAPNPGTLTRHGHLTEMEASRFGADLLRWEGGPHAEEVRLRDQGSSGAFG